MRPAYRELADVPKEKLPMNENEFWTLMIKRLILGAIVLATIGSGSCMAMSFHSDAASIQKAEAAAIQAKSEADKAMWEKMPKKEEAK